MRLVSIGSCADSVLAALVRSTRPPISTMRTSASR